MTVNKIFRMKFGASRGDWEVRGEMDGLMFVYDTINNIMIHLSTADFQKMFREVGMEVQMTVDELATEREAARAVKEEIEGE